MRTLTCRYSKLAGSVPVFGTHGDEIIVVGTENKRFTIIKTFLQYQVLRINHKNLLQWNTRTQITLSCRTKTKAYPMNIHHNRKKVNPVLLLFHFPLFDLYGFWFLADGPEKSSVGRWTNEEHQIFLKGCEEHGKDWKLIADLVGTRTVVQVSICSLRSSI